MGHAEQQQLLAAFRKVANDNQTTLGDLLDNPRLLDMATQRFIPRLNRLRSSWGKNPHWKYASVVKKAYDLIRNDYGDERDRSGALLFYHPLQVADDSFRMSKLFNFDDKEATTIWIAALCHDYLERAGTEKEYQQRLDSLKSKFGAHDPDVTNMVVMLTNRDKSRPYFKYVEQIGYMSGFTSQSTYKAQLGVCLIKDADSGHNEDKTRNLYLDRDRAIAQQLLSSPNKEQRAQGQEMADKVSRTKTKVQMYPLNRALMKSKIKGLLGIEDGLPMHTTMVDFLLTDYGIPYRVQSYASAREVGLGPEGHKHYTELLAQQDEGHDLVILSLKSKRPHTIPAPAPANQSKAPAPHAA